MNIKVCFVASDGMEFGTVKDCILHEVEINPEKYRSFNNGIIMFTNSTMLNKGFNYTDNFFNAYTIVVFDKEKADSYFTHLVDEFGACVPSSDPGIYYFIGDMEWRCRMDNIVGFADALNQLYLKLI